MFAEPRTEHAIKEDVRVLEGELAHLLPTIAVATAGFQGAVIYGLSVFEAKTGRGYNALLRFWLSQVEGSERAAKGLAPGPYVVWGYGDTILSALADCEVQLAEAKASLVVDEFPPKRPEKAPRTGKAGRKGHPAGKPHG